MADKVHVNKKFAEGIQNKAHQSTEPFFGFLLGKHIKNDLYIVGGAQKESGKSWEAEYQHSLEFLPVGIKACGIFFKTAQAGLLPVIKLMLQKLLGPESQLQPCFDTTEILVLAIEQEAGAHSALYSYDLESSDLKQAEMATTEQDLHSVSVMARLRCTLDLSFEADPNKDKFRTNLLNEIVLMEDKLESSMTTFHIKSSNILLGADDEEESRTIHEILGEISQEDVEEYERKKKLKAGDYSKEVIHLELLFETCGEKAGKTNISCAPIIHHHHRKFVNLNLTVPVDIVVYVAPQSPVSTLHKQLVQGLRRQLVTTAKCLLLHSKGQTLLPVRPYHFKPAGLCHVITAVYPKLAENQLEPTRRAIHQCFLLPEDQPLVRRLNEFHFPDEPTSGGLLTNTHIGLSSPGVPGGSQFLVQGTYSYHHYMQDRLDDNGWGCAYRSLQTLMSWFRHQGYTERLPASHTEIQQTLVDMGDKEAKFVGSKQWIGSTEVGFVLDQLLGVTSKILYVSSGAELGSKGRELAVHFQTQGTPIMIGGGVLAHTILGVEWDEVTGDVRFLILDPHYTGGEDLKLIQDKGWCGWKGPEFWDQNAYYNLCMPQRPDLI